jgi:hypothetical protein
MNPSKGTWLYVNLSASQTRRRLQGFGHGVRRIETAGRHRAAILHTATGEHLRELEHLLADVLVTEEEERPDDIDENGF